jgi:hypothetical protein
VNKDTGRALQAVVIAAAIFWLILILRWFR